ncbi:MAG: sensor protein, partial [Streptomyces sp.]|nr:sensor protein [Streptomyces sp.]
ALARKCGIEVRLGEAPAAGVVARVLIPLQLLTEAPQVKAADKPVLPAPRKEKDVEVPPGELVTVQAAAKPAENAGDKAAGGKSTSAARTRNGLVKRPQRSAISDAVSETDRPERPAPAEPTPDRSPEEISGMLSTLRSAHMRGGISAEREKAKGGDKDSPKGAEQKEGDAK